MNPTISAPDADFAEASLRLMVEADVNEILSDAGFLFGTDFDWGDVRMIALSLRGHMVARVTQDGVPYVTFEDDGPLAPLSVAYITANPDHPCHSIHSRRRRREAEEREQCEEWEPPSLPEAIQRRLRGMLPPEIPTDPDDPDLPPI